MILQDLEPKCPVDSEKLLHNLIFPDKSALLEILALEIYCLQRSEGCQWVGKISAVCEHEKDCPFVKVECLNKSLGCNVKLLKFQLAKHVEKECSFRTTECLYCSEKFALASLSKHYENCLNYPVSCSYECGLKDVRKEDLREHEKTCPYRIEPCNFSSIGCSIKLPRQLLKNHLEVAQADHLLLSKKQSDDTRAKVTELQLQVMHIEEKLETQTPQLESFNEVLACTKQTLIAQQVKLGQVEKNVVSQKEIFSEFRQKLDSIMANGNPEKNVKELQDKIFLHEEKLSSIQQELERILNAPFRSKHRFQSLNVGNNPQERRLNSLEQSLGLHDVQLAEHDLKIQILEVASYDGVLLWKIDDFKRRFDDAKERRATSLYSPPFYTSRFGYKCCARLYLNGDGIGKGDYLSLFFVIMKGQYDLLLQWPFGQKITLKLLGRERGEDITETFRPDPNSSSFKRPQSEINLASGCPQFCSHIRLRTGSYVREDTIFIKISVDTTGLPTI